MSSALTYGELFGEFKKEKIPCDAYAQCKECRTFYTKFEFALLEKEIYNSYEVECEYCGNVKEVEAETYRICKCYKGYGDINHIQKLEGRF